MSDLGSEELEEEGENDLGVRALDQGGTYGVRRSSGAGGVGTKGLRGRDRTTPATLAALSPGSRSER